MSNYVQTTFFTPKDTLPTTNPAKTIFGAAYDVEFGNIAAAILSKYDSTTVAPSLLSLTIGTPTGGNLGAGSLNAQSIFVNNAAVLTAAGAVTSLAGTANQIAVSASTGAVTLSLPQNIIIPVPVSGVALTATGIAGTNSAVFGLTQVGDNVALITGSNIYASGANNTAWGTSGTGSAEIRTAALQRVLIANGGGVVINSPTASVNTLTVNQTTSNNGLQVNSTAGVQASIGIAQAGQVGWTIYQPASSNDLRFFGTATDVITLASTGGIIVGAPTGGNQGAGTLNTTGLFINAGQLFFGVPASGSTTAAVTDVGKCINAAAGITVPNAVFSQGHAFSIYNNTAGAITITAGITTMRLAGTAITGNRTLAQRGIATIWFESGTECAVGGPGVS